MTNTLQKLEASRNMFQTNFTPGNLSEYELVGYAQGNKFDNCKTLNLNSFDEVIFIQESENSKDKKKFIHAMGYLNNGSEVKNGSRTIHKMPWRSRMYYLWKISKTTSFTEI